MKKTINFKAIFKVAIIPCFLVVFSCDSEDANDCLQASGRIVLEEIDIIPFERILVNRNIELIIKEATDFKVTIETGENLLNDVRAEVQGNRLVLTDDNNCNWFRDYGLTKIYVEAPNILEIRTSTQYDIRSDGILNYQNLTLLSEDFIESTEFTVGDFRLSLNSENVNIVSNNISFFYLDGMVENLKVGFFAGSGRFEGSNLTTQNIDVFHRGSNDMVVNPQQSLTGELRGTGDLISLNIPPVVEIEQQYTGQLIFN